MRFRNVSMITAQVRNNASAPQYAPLVLPESSSRISTACSSIKHKILTKQNKSGLRCLLASLAQIDF